MPEEKATLSQEAAKNIVDSFIQSTEDAKISREYNFFKYENFVLEGEQWLEGEKPEGNKPCLTFNQSQDFINTYLAKLFPRNMETGVLEIGVKVFEKNKVKKEEQEKEILDTYKNNKLAKTILEQGQNFLVGGSGCFYYPQDPLSGKAKIISLDPTTCYLGWAGSELEQFAFEDEISIAQAEKDTKQNWLITAIRNFWTDEPEETKKFKKTKRFTYWDRNFQIIKTGDTFKVAENKLGFIPISWIPNQPKSHQHEGISEAKKLYSLEKEFNQRASDFAQRVKSNTKPTLAVLTDMDTKDLKFEDISDKGVLPLAKGDDAKFLTLAENKELLDYLKEIKISMANKMAINDAVAGEIKSNVSSLSMVYYFSPLMDRIGLKRVFWDEAFRELNRAILIYKFGTGEYRTNPIYEPVLLTDAKTKLENTALMLENNLISYEDAIDQTRGAENSVEKLAQIIAEKTKYKEILAPAKQNNPKAQEA